MRGTASEMKRLKTDGGNIILISGNEAYLVRGLFGRRLLRFSYFPCDLIGRRCEDGERKVIEICGEAAAEDLTDALITVSRLWRDGATNEIFLLTDSSEKAIAAAAENAEYIEYRRVIRGNVEYDTVLYKRHTDR